MTETTAPERTVFHGPDGTRLVADRWAPVGDPSGLGTVLLLHGGGQTRHSWAATGARLAAHGWTAIALDARGHGDSGWSPTGHYSMDVFVRDLWSVVDALDAPPVLVGASLGGSTALVATGERPGTAAGLVLVDIAPRTNREGRDRVIAFMAGAPDGFGSLDEAADAVAAYNPHRPRPRNPDGLRKNLRQRADGRWYWHSDPRFLQIGDEANRDAQTPRLYAAARRVRVPTLMVRGSGSDVVSAEGAAELRELIPDVRLAEVTAGHMVAGDDNDVFTIRLLDFLSEVRAHAHRD